MNKYLYKVTLKVEVEAFEENDAWDALQDAFGVGEDCGTYVVDAEYKALGTKRS